MVSLFFYAPAKKVKLPNLSSYNFANINDVGMEWGGFL